jgi:hypothetical protein
MLGSKTQGHIGLVLGRHAPDQPLVAGRPDTGGGGGAPGRGRARGDGAAHPELAGGVVLAGGGLAPANLEAAASEPAEKNGDVGVDSVLPGLIHSA